MRFRILSVALSWGLALAGPYDFTCSAEPVGWWRFDEAAGSIASDSSGSGFDAAVYLGGGPAIWDANAGFDSKGAAKFAAKQYVLIPNGVWNRIDSQMSIAFWVNQDANHPPGGNWPGPWGCATTPGLSWPQPNWLQLRAFVPTPDGAISIGKDEETTWWQADDANDYAGRWNHYVFIKDVNDHTLALYHNGIRVDYRTSQMEPMPDINSFFVGGRTYPYADWYGRIDDLRVYDCALSQLDITKLARTNPAAAWNEFPFDNASDVPTNIVLAWSPGDYAAEAGGHDLYLGTNHAEVSAAEPILLAGDLDMDGAVGITDLNELVDCWLAGPPCPDLAAGAIVSFPDFAALAGNWGKQGIYKGRRSACGYSPESLDSGITYYWRVDEVNEANIWKGPAWQFTTKGPSFVFNDGPGNVRSLIASGEIVDARTALWVPMKGWSPIATSDVWNVSGVVFSGSGALRQWTGVMPADGNQFDYRITQRHESSDVNLQLEITSRTNAATEGVYYNMYLPVFAFSQGRVELWNGPALTGSVTLPPVLPPDYQLLYGAADRIIVYNAAADVNVAITLDRIVSINVQDNRQWNDSAYAVMMRFHDGNLPSGQKAALRARILATAMPDGNTAHITVDPCTMLYHFDGWGGTFCFNIESPQTQYNIETLNPAWTRTEMSINEWEPSNDNSDANNVNWAYLAGQVTAGSNLEREMLLAKQLQDRGVPQLISIWHLPGWMQPVPATEIAPQMWPEVVESICSYLEFARSHYGVEPNYFSFNEPSIGVDVLFTPEGHRDAIRRLGDAFSARGLKTKMALAEACSPTVSTSYAQPTIDDPCALQYVGAVTIHSWPWGDYPEWAAGVASWSNVAVSIGVPLVIGEAGSDAGAWRTPWLIPTFDYAIQDLRNFVGLVHYGRPSGVMHWEYTDDYSLVDLSRLRPVPDNRYCYIKQIHDYSADSNAVAVACDNNNLMAVAFVGRNAGMTRLTAHVANFGAACRLTLTGLPPGAGNVAIIRTTETEQLRNLGSLTPVTGSVTVDLARLSLTTLTATLDD